jgi:hypothetical protein
VLIDAARILADRGYGDVRFILAGDEQGRTGYVAELDEKIARAGLSGIVRRVGHCEDMPAAFLAASAVVVVFPCVPAITIFLRPLSTKFASNAGNEVNANARVSSSHSTSAFPRDIAFPMTTRSGANFANRTAS